MPTRLTTVPLQFHNRSTSAPVPIALNIRQDVGRWLPRICTFCLHQTQKTPHTTRGFEKVVRPEGLEPPTSWFVARRSIQLSYGRTLLSNIHHTGNIRVFQLPRTAKYGGEAGIRTLGEFPHTHLAGVRLQPLGHLSQKKPGGGRGTRTPMGFHPAVFKTAALPIRTSPPVPARRASAYANHNPIEP